MTSSNADTRLYGFVSPWFSVTPEPMILLSPEPMILLSRWKQIIEYLKALYR